MALEELKTIESISLDFYNNNIKTINAKQFDTGSRYVKISCTEHGKKVTLDPNTMSVYMISQNPNNLYAINNCQILDDGALLVDFSQQMLSVSGKSKVDILIVSGAISEDVVVDGITTTDDGQGNVTTSYNLDSFVQIIYNSGASILTTMSFYLNVLPNNIKDIKIECNDEFNGLLDELEQINTYKVHVVALEELLTENEEIRLQNESERQNAETERVNAENSRVVAENVREENMQIAIEKCNTAISNTNEATINANQATENANTKIEECTTAISNANTATQNANDAADNCRNVIEQGGIVLKTDIANNLETETEGKVLDATQGKILLELINSKHEKLFDLIYPIGSVYISVNEVNPGEIFGGTWERIQDRFLLAAGETYTAGETGGEATHTLSIDEMPSHHHGIPHGYVGLTPAEINISYSDNMKTGTYQPTTSAGGNQPHNNMPPYLTVYIWKRTM